MSNIQKKKSGFNPCTQMFGTYYFLVCIYINVMLKLYTHKWSLFANILYCSVYEKCI